MAEEIGHILQNKVDLISDSVSDLGNTEEIEEILKSLQDLRNEIPCSCDTCE